MLVIYLKFDKLVTFILFFGSGFSYLKLKRILFLNTLVGCLGFMAYQLLLVI